jgi:hypothetical protein
MWVVPQWFVRFKPFDGAPEELEWTVDGEADLESVCKTLRWNGIHDYVVGSVPNNLCPAPTPPEDK